MSLNYFDIGVFVAYIVAVVAFSIYKSRHERTSEDYFLAGRGVSWFLIGFSLIAANISTEQFVGMSGSSAGNVGLAIASYEWIAAVSLVCVGLFFLPRFLRSGIYTIPEFLEYRYNAGARAVMAAFTMVIYVGVTIAAVVYSGGLTISTIFDVPLYHSIFIIGAVAALYTTLGGLKAIVWADLFMGSALILGGALVMVLGFRHPDVGGVSQFMETNADKLHMILPRDHPELPWTAMLLGIWIPNFYYWGLNQYITQRTLAAKSLRAGQTGIMFAAALKLIIPFIIVIPGIMAINLYPVEVGETKDAAYPMLIRNLVPNGLKGFMFAAIAGAVLSSLASMLNSASTIFTMDLYKRHMRRNASQAELVAIGRSTTILFVVIGGIVATRLADPKFGGVYTFIQEFQGYISPGILAAFTFGFVFKRTPAAAAITAMVLCPILYNFFKYFVPAFTNMAFLNRMALTYAILIAVMAIITWLKPLKEPRVLPVNDEIELEPAPGARWAGGLIIALTVGLYIYFW